MAVKVKNWKQEYAGVRVAGKTQMIDKKNLRVAAFLEKFPNAKKFPVPFNLPQIGDFTDRKSAEKAFGDLFDVYEAIGNGEKEMEITAPDGSTKVIPVSQFSPHQRNAKARGSEKRFNPLPEKASVALRRIVNLGLKEAASELAQAYAVDNLVIKTAKPGTKAAQKAAPDLENSF